MLLKLLTLIQSGRFQTHQDIAAALGVPPGLVILMAEQLVQQGYLQLISSCITEEMTDGNCDNCSAHSGCFFATALQGWLLTERGQRMALSNAS